MGIVAAQGKIRKTEVEQVAHPGIDFQQGQGPRIPAQLFIHLVDMVVVNVHIAEGMNKLPRLQS